ncbi:MAG: hypothetical protein FWD48_07935 [Oscillospiraceae bacterium]|nr:hypothetical protein [Oscillospiraceae bacterium]
MQSYEGYLEDGRFFPFAGTQVALNGRRRVTVTIFDEEIAEAKRQAELKLFAELAKAERIEEEQGEECLLTPDEVDALIDSI